MDLKKFLDQTVREVKREVNKKVLKVPEIEQKVYEATSNEPWGPHGTLMGDIAQATRNHQEYQMIMSILWKRLNDNGRNWRHVYKSLTVLEFLVANGAERIIDELREHSYQVQTLADFQYMEPGGKDQGLNVRKKAQTLVSLLSDKERIREVRAKAAANRDKYRGVSNQGTFARTGSYSSTSGGYGERDQDEDRYGSRDEDRYGDRDRYGDKDRDRDGDRYRDDRYKDEDRYRDDKDRDRYEDDRYGSRGGDGPSNGRYGDDSRNGGSNYGRDRDRYGSFDDDDSNSRRGNGSASGSKAEDYSQDDREQSGLAAAVARAHSTQSNQSQSSTSTVTQNTEQKTTVPVGGSYFATHPPADDADDFDPRGSGAASSSRQEDPFATSSTSAPAPLSAPLPPPGTAKPTSSIEDLFGDGGFDSGFVAAPAVATGASGSSQVTAPQDDDLFGPGAFSADSFTATSSFSASSIQYPPSGASGNTSANGNFQQTFTAVDSSASFSSSTAFPPPSAPATQSNFLPATALFPGQTSFPPPASTYGSFPPTAGPAPSQTSFHHQGPTMPGQMNFPPPASAIPSQMSFPPVSNTGQMNFPYASGPDPHGLVGGSSTGSISKASGPSSLESLSTGTASQPQKPPQKPFQPKKSSIWGDSLNSGLIDLNISGSKTNPLAELGIDLKDSIFSVQEKRKEEISKPTANNMGRAMGSGTGLGLVGAGGIPPPAGPMMGGMNMGMGMGAPSMGMGMGAGMGAGMGMGMTPGYGGAPGMPPTAAYGMNVGMGPSQGYGAPGGMGMNPNLGMNGSMGGFGMNQGGYGGMGGYPNQQYGGFR